MYIANMLHYFLISSFQLPAALSVAFFVLTRIMEEKTMNNYKYEEQSGRSMIEMLGVLAIIGVLSVGGIAGYSKAMTKFKTNKVADNVAMIVTNIRTLYAQQQNYSGLDNDSAIQMGVVPDELVGTLSGTTQALKNAFLGTVYIGAGTVTGMDAGTDSGANRGFFVIMNGLPKEACVTLATNDWGSGYSSGLVGIVASGAEQTADSALVQKVNCKGGTTASNNIGGNGTALASTNMELNDTPAATIMSACVNGSVQKTPMNVAEAAKACSSTANANSILWKYY